MINKNQNKNKTENKYNKINRNQSYDVARYTYIRVIFIPIDNNVLFF